MNNQPTISIIVPIYNVGKHLVRCIDSIVNQSYGNIEVILVNDGSTDGSGKIADSYAQKDERIRVVHKSNSGVSSARNAGLEKATGDYVMFVDADDRIDLQTCEICVQHIKHDEDLVSFTVSRVDKKERGRVKEGKADGSVDYLSTNEQIIKDYLKGTDLRAVAHLFKRSTLGELRFNEDMRIHEDAVFAFQFLTKSKNAVIINKPLYTYISRSDSAMKKFQKSDAVDIRHHYDEIMGFFTSKYPGLKLEAHHRTTSILFNLLTVAKQTGNKLELYRVRGEICQNKEKIQNKYRMSMPHKVKLVLSYCPVTIFNLGLLLFRKIRRVT